MFQKFEFHGRELFASNVVINADKEKNVWNFYTNPEKFKAVNDLIKDIDLYVESYVFYVANRSKVEVAYVTELSNIHKLSDGDMFCDSLLIEKMITDFSKKLNESKTKGLIVPDRLDSKTRNEFLSIYAKEIAQLDNMWLEPIMVHSHKNAFTQYVDLITYLYYVYTSNLTGRSYFESTKRIFEEKIPGEVEHINLV